MTFKIFFPSNFARTVLLEQKMNDTSRSTNLVYHDFFSWIEIVQILPFAFAKSSEVFRSELMKNFLSKNVESIPKKILMAVACWSISKTFLDVFFTKWLWLTWKIKMRSLKSLSEISDIHVRCSKRTFSTSSVCHFESFVWPYLNQGPKSLF